MSLSPILTAPPVIQFHLAAGCVAILLGPVVLYLRKPRRWHRRLGYVWVCSMLLLAVSAFFIEAETSPFRFGLLYLLAFLVLWALWTGIGHIRAGRVREHQARMRSLYWNGVAIAGIFTVLPDRVFNRILFPETPELGWVVIALGGAVLAWRGLAGRARPATV